MAPFPSPTLAAQLDELTKLPLVAAAPHNPVSTDPPPVIDPAAYAASQRWDGLHEALSHWAAPNIIQDGDTQYTWFDLQVGTASRSYRLDENGLLSVLGDEGSEY